MQTDHSNAEPTTSKNSPKKPLTQAEALRAQLKDLELRIARLKESHAEDALQILPLLDQTEATLSNLREAGSVVSSEDSHFETILAQFHGKRRVFLARIGGNTALEKARQEHQPAADQWWWFVDQALAVERRARLRKVLIGAGVFLIAIIGLVVAYQRFFAPDPALQASVGYQTTAENLLIEGRYEEALVEVNQALVHTPDHPNLLVLQGVIYEMLEQPEQAEKSFEAALEIYPDAGAFYSERAGYYIMVAQPELALKDAETAIELDRDLASAFLRKAQAYELLGDRTMAIKYYQLASDVAERIGSPQLQVIARMSMAQLLQQIDTSLPTQTDDAE